VTDSGSPTTYILKERGKRRLVTND